ncbi:MAG: sarcosine oxidase subunit gamma family protein, partial [Pseudomonadota bacterium]
MSETLKAPLASISRLEGRGMITLRGDLANPELQAAVTQLTGVDMVQTRQAYLSGDRGLAWMSPDELLVFVPAGEVAAALVTLEQSLKDQHHLAVDVSDARALFAIEGASARDVLAKGAPVDLHPSAFGPGQIRRTRLGQLACAFWMTSETRFELVCFASVGHHVDTWQTTAARPGSEVSFLS